MPKIMRNMGYNHFGDLDYHQGLLFIPVEGVGGPGKNPALAIFKASNLELINLISLTKWMDDAPWCAINPANGLLYLSNYNHIDPIYRFRVNIVEDTKGTKVSIEFEDYFQYFYDQQCAPLQLTKIQGGTFSPNGKYLFLATGSIAKINKKNHGIWIIDHDEHRLLSKSYAVPSEQGLSSPPPPLIVSKGRRKIKGQAWEVMPDFRYEFHPGWKRFEETEGLTYWDLDHPPAQSPKAKGQLHVLMLNNGLRDNIYIKHYRLFPNIEFEQKPSTPSALGH